MPASVLIVTLALIAAASLPGSLSGSLSLERLRGVDVRTQGSARRLFACAAASRVLLIHRRNLQRLRAGSESRYGRVRLLRKRA